MDEREREREKEEQVRAIVVIGIIKIRGLKLFRFMPALLSSCGAGAPVTRRDSIPGNKFHALFRTRPRCNPRSMEAILWKKSFLISRPSSACLQPCVCIVRTRLPAVFHLSRKRKTRTATKCPRTGSLPGDIAVYKAVEKKKGFC